MSRIPRFLITVALALFAAPSALAAEADRPATTDYVALGRIDFLPELRTLDLAGKARVIQSLLEENFFHPSGLFYSLLLIDGPQHVRPMVRADLESSGVDAGQQTTYDESTRAAMRDEGMTFENSIYSAGLYLQAQAARYAVTKDPAAYAQGVRGLEALRLVYDDGRRRGRAGWLGKPYGMVPKEHSTHDQYHAALIGLYRFHEVAAPPERDEITAMLRDIADFMTARNYVIWDLAQPTDGHPWSIGFAYHNTTNVLGQAIAFRVTGDEKYRREALRLIDLGSWRRQTYLDEWRAEGRERVLEFERVCLGAFILQAVDVLDELLPEAFGDTPEARAATLESLCDRWWRFCRLGMDDDGYQRYWIDIDVRNGTWRPTGVRRQDPPGYPGSFGRYFSDVRWSDQLYRNVTAALTVAEHCPTEREATLAWIREVMEKTDGRRLRWFIDLDGRQLVEEDRWMGCMLSSEAPFHYLITSWRGVAGGLWE